jgi:HEAT repeat protein
MIDIGSSDTWWTAARWALGLSGAVVAMAAACSWLWRAVRRAVLTRRDLRHAGARAVMDALASWEPNAAPDVAPRVRLDDVFLTCLADRFDRSPDDLRVRLAEHAERFGYVARFRALSRSPWARQRLRAARWLGRLQHRDGVPDLIRLAEDRSSRVRVAAVAALGTARDARAPSALAALLDQHASAPARRIVPVQVLTRALVAHGADGIVLAVSRLQSPSAAVRTAAADVLTSAADPHPSLRAALLSALNDGECEVRARAARAIGNIGDAGAVVSLIKTLADPVWFVRLQTAKAIGALAHERAVRALVTALTDEAWQVRAAAAEALRRVGGPAVSALTECLFESRDRYAKEQVVEELQRTPLLLEQVEALDGTHDGAAFAAQRFLREMARHGATSVLLDALRRHPRAGVRRRLVAVLGVVDAPRVIAALHDVAEHDRDAGVREASRRALTGRPDWSMGTRADRERAA